MTAAKWPRICAPCGGLNAAKFTACIFCSAELPNRRASDARYNNRNRSERRAATRAERAARAKPAMIALSILRACAASQN